MLILDDRGLEPLDAVARHDVLGILEDRYERRSAVATSFERKGTARMDHT